MKKTFIIIIATLLLASCNNNFAEPITFESEAEMLSYLSNNKWILSDDDSNSWLIFSDDGFGEFSNSNNLGYGQFIDMAPQEGTFNLNGKKYMISSTTGDIVNYKNPKENYKLSLSTPDVEIGGDVLKRYVYSNHSPNGKTLVSIQLTNTGKRNYTSIGFDIVISDNNNNSITLESDYIDLAPGQSGSCSAFSNDIPYSYTNVNVKIKNYYSNK